jgi:hypothetical protein
VSKLSASPHTVPTREARRAGERSEELSASPHTVPTREARRAGERSGEFFTKALLFIVTLVPLYFLLHEALYEAHHWLRTRNDPNAIYVLGDSRTYNAVDLTALRERTGRQFNSYMQHAMSDYSLLKMAEMVPPGSTVLFGPSWGLMLRDKEDSSYASGFSLRGLKNLLFGAGEYWHFRKIFVMNRIPLEAPFFKETPYPLDELDEPRTANREKVRSFYTQPKPPYFEAKKRMVTEALQLLLDKGCRLEVVDIPVPADVAEVRDRGHGSVIDELEVLRHPRVRIWKDIPLVDPNGKNVWADADHMNQRGRRLMTEFFASKVFARPG